jgi:hypothetical protein
MKDILDREIKIGHVVAYTNANHGQSIRLGIVRRFCKDNEDAIMVDVVSHTSYVVDRNKPYGSDCGYRYSRGVSFRARLMISDRIVVVDSTTKDVIAEMHDEQEFNAQLAKEEAARKNGNA